MWNLLKYFIVFVVLVIAALFNPAFASDSTWIMQVTRGRVNLQTAELISREIYKQSLAQDVDPNTIFRIIAVESMFNTRAISNKNARGLMQVMPKYHRHRYRGENIHNVSTNIRVGVEIYAEYTQSSYCGGDANCGLRRYYGALKSNAYTNKMLAVKLPVSTPLPIEEVPSPTQVCVKNEYMDHDIPDSEECKNG